MGGVAVLYVHGLTRMGAFYAALNLSVEEKADSFVVLRSEDWELTLVKMPADIARQNPLQDPPVRRERVPVKLAFVVDRIQRLRPVLEALGGAADDPANEWVFGGMRRCDATDPEGNVIQLLEPVAAPAAG
jgi:catechol-2,3-dioxygenase